MLNGVMIKTYLQREGRKRSWLVEQLGISASLLDRMVTGYVPTDPELVEKLRKILGCSKTELVLAVELPRKVFA